MGNKRKKNEKRIRTNRRKIYYPDNIDNERISENSFDNHPSSPSFSPMKMVIPFVGSGSEYVVAKMELIGSTYIN